MNDEIMREVWQIRDRLAEKYDHNLDVIIAALQERQAHPLTSMVKKPRLSKTLKRIDDLHD